MQDQWLNLFLLNKFEFSYYSILYFLSGFLFPIVVINNSLSNFFEYKFSSNNYENNKLRFIGYLFTFTLLILSLLIIRYFIFSINYIIPQIDLNIYFDIKLKIFFLLVVMILLLINKTKRFIKRLILLNFFIIFLINWSTYFLNLQGKEIFVNKYIFDNNYYDFYNINILSTSFLFIIEIFYFLWSFITYQKNLSDWSINFPKRVDLIPVSKITIFYLGVLIYYLIFKRVS